MKEKKDIEDNSAKDKKEEIVKNNKEKEKEKERDRSLNESAYGKTTGSFEKIFSDANSNKDNVEEDKTKEKM